MRGSIYFGSSVSLCHIEDMLPLLIQDSSNFKRGPSGFAWGSEKIRGVNLGGWLVLEVSTLSRNRM